eukprot:TRINITY_DN2665_c0_g1_i1.p2 TRINITY_DN2665_c0_g1~~TRINITY_DN2665_c0_g1_i1.p2  ORF type:complete len:140 (-),score=41.57 TRINITY_DN2665_c0_g1_i1:922-1341(-)
MDEAARQFVATRLRRVAREEAEAGAVVDGKGTVPPPQQVGTAQLAAAVPTSAKLFGVTALLADLRRASGGTAAGDAGAGGRCCFEPSDENSYPPPLAVDHLHDDDYWWQAASIRAPCAGKRPARHSSSCWKCSCVALLL